MTAGNYTEEKTPRDALEKKIFLIKKMINNEKEANKMISNQLSHLVNDLHMNNRTVNSAVDRLKMGRSGQVPQKMWIHSPKSVGLSSLSLSRYA